MIGLLHLMAKPFQATIQVGLHRGYLDALQIGNLSHRPPKPVHEDNCNSLAIGEPSEGRTQSRFDQRIARLRSFDQGGGTPPGTSPGLANPKQVTPRIGHRAHLRPVLPCEGEGLRRCFSATLVAVEGNEGPSYGGFGLLHEIPELPLVGRVHSSPIGDLYLNRVART